MLTARTAAATALICCGLSASPTLGRAAEPSLVTSPLNFTGAYKIDGLSPYTHSTSVGYLSCPSTTFCAALDNNGNILTTREPTASANTWSDTRVPTYGDFGLVCPTTSFCLGLAGSDANGQEAVLTSTDPTGGAAAWQIYTAPSTLEHLSCPTSDFCAALDGSNGIWTTDDPAGGASTWQWSQFTSDQIAGNSLTCVSASLCLIGAGGLGGPGSLYTSTDPNGGTAAWSQSQVSADGISCPTANLCVAATFSGVAVSIDPTGGTSAWHQTQFESPNYDQREVIGVTCTAASFCVALGSDGSVWSTHDPVGGAWADVPGQAQIPNATASGWDTPAACPADNLCVAAVGNGDMAVSTDPAGSAGSWPAVNVDGFNVPTSVSCTSDAFCVAVDDDGNVLTSTQPQTQGLWAAQHIDSTTIEDVSCVAGPLCVAVDNGGNVLASTDPSGAPASWSTAQIDSPYVLDRVSCASGPVCVAVDNAGNAFVSTDPLGGAGAWQKRQIFSPGGSNWLTDAACADRNLCVISSTDALYVAQAPGQADATWQAIQPFFNSSDSAESYQSVSCPSADFCAASLDGQVLVSTDPAGGAGAWSTGGYGSYTVSCQSASLCVSLGLEDDTYESSSPTTQYEQWGMATDYYPDENPLVPQLGASCPSAQFCIVVGDEGLAWNGVGPAYVPPAVAPVAESGFCTDGGSLPWPVAATAGAPFSAQFGLPVVGGPGPNQPPSPTACPPGYQVPPATGDGAGSGTPAPPPAQPGPAPAPAPATVTPSASPQGDGAAATPVTSAVSTTGGQGSARVSVRTRLATVTRRPPVLSLRLGCAPGGITCAGSLSLRAGGVVLGRHVYRLRAGRTGVVRIDVSRIAVTLLARRRDRGLPVTLLITPSAGSRAGKSRSVRLNLSLLPK